MTDWKNQAGTEKSIVPRAPDNVDWDKFDDPYFDPFDGGSKIQGSPAHPLPSVGAMNTQGATIPSKADSLSTQQHVTSDDFESVERMPEKQ